MTAMSESDHTAYRKKFSAHYVNAHVAKFLPEVTERIVLLVEVRFRVLPSQSQLTIATYTSSAKILDSASYQSVDCIHLLRYLLVDVMRVTLFGLQPLSLETWKACKPDPICDVVRDFPMRSVLVCFSAACASVARVTP